MPEVFDFVDGCTRVVCAVCNEWLVPVGNGTWEHGLGHWRSRGHRHRPRARFAAEPHAGEGQLRLPLGVGVHRGPG